MQVGLAWWLTGGSICALLCNARWRTRAVHPENIASGVTILGRVRHRLREARQYLVWTNNLYHHRFQRVCITRKATYTVSWSGAIPDPRITAVTGPGLERVHQKTFPEYSPPAETPQ